MKVLTTAYKANYAVYHTRQVRVLWRVCTIAWLLPDPSHLAQMPRTVHLPAAEAPTILSAPNPVLPVRRLLRRPTRAHLGALTS